MLRAICLILIAIGAAMVATAAYRYYKFIRRFHAESYYETSFNRTVHRISLVTLVFFILGYIVGAIDLIRRDVEPIYMFVIFVFFVGGVYIASLIHTQINMTKSLRKKTMEVMKTFVNSIELKDRYTKGHSQHVYDLVRVFCDYLPSELRATVNRPKLYDAALLHDIGKIGVPDHILNKQAPLTDEEWERIRTHPKLGAKLLSDTCFSEISQWVLFHHERVDGTGYFFLSQKDIPIEAQIIAVADTYSAITTDRAYRMRKNHEEALEIMRAISDTQLNAQLVQCFSSIPKKKLLSLHAKLIHSSEAKEAAG